MANDPTRQLEMVTLQQRIGYSLQRPDLLQRALTHSSLAYEQAAEGLTMPDSADNEQLEFLGDAVVGLIVADSLYRRYPELREGELTRLRAALVSRQHLVEVAGKLQVGDALFLGKGEERSGGRKKSAILADCVEAVIGAIYLDGGLDAARVFVGRWVFEPYVGELREAIEGGGTIGDHKSALQEFLQARKAGQPQYVVKGESGPDHRKRFLVEVRIGSGSPKAGENTEKLRILARGSGTTKKHAEQEAARRAYHKLLKESSAGEAEYPVTEELVS